MRAAAVAVIAAQWSSGKPQVWIASSSTAGNIVWMTLRPSGACQIESRPASFSAVV